jgi:hypothetical protein
LSTHKDEGASPFAPDARLLAFRATQIYSADQMEKLGSHLNTAIDTDKLNKETDTIHYTGGKIYISCLKAAAGCAQYQGDISFSGDTLQLKLVQVSDLVCTEVNIWRCVYEIENTNNQQFIIKKY